MTDCDYSYVSKAVCDAFTFWTLLMRAKAKLPDVSVANDGEVAFCWFLPDGVVDLGFFGDGTYSYYAQPIKRGVDSHPCDYLCPDLLSVIGTEE